MQNTLFELTYRHGQSYSNHLSTIKLIQDKLGFDLPYVTFHWAGADLRKMLTDLLQNERRRRKLLERSGGMFPREIFSILTT